MRADRVVRPYEDTDCGSSRTPTPTENDMANGIVIIDKPAGWTSMDVCAKLRGILKTKKVGHAGTLDPMATGVLPVFVGQATRGVSFAEDGEKEYVATLHLGQATDTQDTSGTVLEEHPVTVTRADVEAILPRFTGEIRQIPPMYSALKVNGQKLCDLARKGVEVERKARTITVFGIALEQQLSPADYILRVRCSKGTYIRTLCHDIGQALGCGGCMAALRRTMAAGFSIEEAHTIDEVQEMGNAILTPLDSLFRQHEEYRLTGGSRESRCRNGNPFPADLPDGIYRVYGQDGTFLCLSRCQGGTMTSLKNFFGA